jgi:hypothetical protein
MKTFAWSLLLSLLFTFTPQICFTQDLSNLIPTAHYTLINTAEDALGLQQPVELTNTPYFDNEGVYSNGLYIGDYPNGSLLLTPFMGALYDSVFALQVEFRLTGLDDTIRPVFTCGTSYRYLGFLVWPDSTFFILYNNNNFLQVPGLRAEEDVWYEVTLIHHSPSSLTEWYLDGAKVYEINVPLDRNMTDGEVSNTNFAMGRTFKGYLRNLRFYGSEEITAIHGITATVKGLRMYPNPTTGNLYVDCTDGQITYWRISDAKGTIVKAGNVTLGTNELSTHDLIRGLFIVHFLDVHEDPVGSERFIKEK